MINTLLFDSMRDALNLLTIVLYRPSFRRHAAFHRISSPSVVAYRNLALLNVWQIMQSDKSMLSSFLVLDDVVFNGELA